MHRDNVVSRVRVRARLHGRNETHRAVRAVLAVLASVAPPEAFRALTAALPAELRPTAAGPGPAETSRQFVAGVAGCLYLDEPSAAFLARVVFEELNAAFPATGPARIAGGLPADLRPLLTARPPADDHHRRLLSVRGLAAPPLRRAGVAAGDPARAGVEELGNLGPVRVVRPVDARPTGRAEISG